MESPSDALLFDGDAELLLDESGSVLTCDVIAPNGDVLLHDADATRLVFDADGGLLTAEDPLGDLVFDLDGARLAYDADGSQLTAN